jgi:peptidyl-prolyl cis-trans isomerase C
LGEFTPGQMVKEFDRVVFSAPVGEVQGPVKTQFGYHLVEVTRRAE